MSAARRRAVGTIAALALAVVLGGCASGGGPTLVYDLSPGDRFTLEVDQQQVSERTFGEQHMVDTTSTYSVDAFEITGKRDDRLEVSIVYGDRSLEHSRSPDDGPDFSALKGKRASFCMDRSGTVADFDGFLSLPMIPAPSGSYNAKRYQIELERLFPYLPNAKLSVGDTWTHHAEFQDRSSSPPMGIVLDHVYTYRGPDADDPALMVIDGTYSVEVSGTADAGNFFVDVRMEGEGSEIIRFDPGHGMIASVSGTMWIEGSAVNEEAEFTVPLRNEYVTEIRAQF